MKRQLASRLLVITGWLMAGATGELHAEKGEANGAERAALTVTLTQSRQAVWPQTLMVSGAIHAWQEAVVSAEVGGLAIVSLPVD
ncbi:MAG: efflux RND transporter periplasmic adaptor subunit, partial [Magnetococcales bacterium]|nr:efflux RND transporter periplasmic adaptor subunit [Magnetococcales bacterium]